MANKKDNYKKIRTDIINGKKRCIYMKPKGKREYVKSKGEFVLLSVYIKKMQKKNKKRVVRGGGEEEDEALIKAMKARATMRERVNNHIINSFRKSNAYVSGLLNKKVPYEPEINERWEKPLIPDVEDLNQNWYQNYLLDRGQYLQNNKSKRKAKESYEKGKLVRKSIIKALTHKDKKTTQNQYGVSADLVYDNRRLPHIEEERTGYA